MLTDEHLEALATVHLHPQTQAGGEVDLMPLLRAVEAASRADERERCAKLAADERHVYSDDEWRVRCEVADAIRDPDAGA